MKIYRLNKIRVTIQLLSFGIITPVVIIFILNYIFNDKSSRTINEIKIFIFLTFLVFSFLGTSHYLLIIEINSDEVYFISPLGKIAINWDEITKLKFNNYSKTIILKGIKGKKLYFTHNIINYKSLFLEIYEQIKLHEKVSITDKSFIDYIDTIKDES